MNRRLSRKEIKRDEFMESVGGALDYAQHHSRKLLAVALAIVVLLVVVVVALGYRQRQAERADQALADALRVFQAPVDAAAADPENARAPSFASVGQRSQAAEAALRELRETYGGSDAARIAAAYLGRIAMDKGDQAEARALWEEVVSGSSEDMLAAEVRVNLMALDRAEDRGDELVTRLRAMLSGPDEGLPHDLLWYQLALTLESLDREAEAQEAYERLLEDHPQSAFASEARQRTGGSAASLFGS